VKKFLWMAPCLALLVSCRGLVPDVGIQAAVDDLVRQGIITPEQAPAMVEAFKSLLAEAGGIDWGQTLGSIGAAILGALGLTRYWRGPSTKPKPKP
jgi:hypothetical protein